MPRSDLDHLGQRIRDLRAARRWSLGDLAEALDASPAAVASWERGTAVPSTTSLIGLAEAFDVGLDELLGWVPPAEVQRPPSQIGGSDAAIVLGVAAPWARSPVALWQRLVFGREDDAPASPQLEAGRRLEAAILRWWAERRRVWPGALEYGVTLTHDEHSFLSGHPDAVVAGYYVPECVASEKIIVEAKLVRGWRGWGQEGTDEIPPYYLAQCRHYLALAREARAVEVAAYCDATREIRIYRVDQDRDAGEAHVEAIARWWRAHVEPARAAIARGDDPWCYAPSDAVEPPPLVLHKGEAVAEAEELELVARYRELRRRSEELGREIEEVRRAIGERLQARGANVLVDDDGAPLARLTAVEARSLDQRALLARHPEIEGEEALWRTRRYSRLTIMAGEDGD